MAQPAPEPTAHRHRSLRPPPSGQTTPPLISPPSICFFLPHAVLSLSLNPSQEPWPKLRALPVSSPSEAALASYPLGLGHPRRCRTSSARRSPKTRAKSLLPRLRQVPIAGPCFCCIGKLQFKQRWTSASDPCPAFRSCAVPAMSLLRRCSLVGPPSSSTRCLVAAATAAVRQAPQPLVLCAPVDRIPRQGPAIPASSPPLGRRPPHRSPLAPLTTFPASR